MLHVYVDSQLYVQFQRVMVRVRVQGYKNYNNFNHYENTCTHVEALVDDPVEGNLEVDLGVEAARLFDCCRHILVPVPGTKRVHALRHLRVAVIPVLYVGCEKFI